MSIWIEIHCDVLKGGCDPNNILQNRCHSNRNENPAGMARNTQKSVARVMRSIAKDAQQSGWKRTKDGWRCPGCQ